MTPVFIVAIIFGSIAAVIIVPFYLRSQERMRVQETLRAAIESGQPMPTEMMENAARNINIRPAPSPSRDLRTGIIWLGVGLGFIAMGVALGYEEPESTIPMIACAAFPVFIGLAFIALSFLNRPKS
jgi:predicted permease